MSKRTGIILGAGAVVIVLLAYGLYLFQPWALFTDKHVDEALPAATSSASGAETPTFTTVSSGTFVSLDHPTQGTATLLTSGSGQQVVRLTNFETDNGPDVKVWLSTKPASQAREARDFTYVNLGDLKGNIGNQNYAVPASADGETWRSVVIWCDRFSVPFGAADLTS